MIETKRLFLRELQQLDYKDLSKILQDKDVMYAYEGAFTNEQTQSWLNKQLSRYREDGYGLYAVILKETGEMIGQCGLTLQDYKNLKVVEIGYLFKKAFWHRGYATEAARACEAYAFNVLNINEVYSIIRNTNIASQNVAKRLGMQKIDTIIKHYRCIDMPHDVYVIKRNRT